MASHESRAFNKQFQQGETSEKRVKPLREVRRDDNFSGDFNCALKAWDSIKEDASVNNSHYWQFLPKTEQDQYVNCLQRCEISHGEFIDAGESHKEEFIKNSKELIDLHRKIKTKLEEFESNKMISSFVAIKKCCKSWRALAEQREQELPTYRKLYQSEELNEFIAQCDHKLEAFKEINDGIEKWLHNYGHIQHSELNLSNQLIQYKEQNLHLEARWTNIRLEYKTINMRVVKEMDDMMQSVELFLEQVQQLKQSGLLRFLNPNYYQLRTKSDELYKQISETNGYCTSSIGESNMRDELIGEYLPRIEKAKEELQLW